MTDYLNPRIPEGINTSESRPVLDFLLLTGGVLGVLVLALMFLGLGARWLAPLIPFSYEVGIAAPLVETVRKDESPGDERIRSYLQELADRLAAAQGLGPGMPIAVHYVDDDTVNAMATLGGNLVVYRGLLERLPNENALAMVMGHEIAHVRHRDPIVSLGQGVVVDVALAALSGVASSDMTRQVMGEAGLLTTLSFSREQERDADSAALQSLAAVYGHAAGGTDLYRVLLNPGEEGSGPGIDFFDTHPDTRRRILTMEAEAKAQGFVTDGPITPLPSWLRESLAEAKAARR